MYIHAAGVYQACLMGNSQGNTLIITGNFSVMHYNYRLLHIIIIPVSWQCGIWVTYKGVPLGISQSMQSTCHGAFYNIVVMLFISTRVKPTWERWLLLYSGVGRGGNNNYYNNVMCYENLQYRCAEAAKECKKIRPQGRAKRDTLSRLPPNSHIHLDGGGGNMPSSSRNAINY